MRYPGRGYNPMVAQRSTLHRKAAVSIPDRSGGRISFPESWTSCADSSSDAAVVLLNVLGCRLTNVVHFVVQRTDLWIRVQELCESRGGCPDGHLDFHTAPELCALSCSTLFIGKQLCKRIFIRRLHLMWTRSSRLVSVFVPRLCYSSNTYMVKRYRSFDMPNVQVAGYSPTRI